MIKFDKTLTGSVSIPTWAAEELLKAPSFCVKFYLYALLRSEAADADMICAETGLKTAEVMEAIDTLSTLGLFMPSDDVTGIVLAPAPPAVEPHAEEVYNDSEYNSMLQALFSDRVLSFNDYKTFYEVREVYGLPVNVVYMLAEYCINHHKAKNRLPMSYIREEGRAWAKEGIDTVHLAEEKMAVAASADEGVRDVLRSLGITHKSPSDEERALYDKWTREWGFSLGGIRASMAATTRAQYPSMKYLDSILKELYKDGLLTREDISAHLTHAEETDERIKELLKRLGAPRLTVTKEHRSMLSRWRSMGFTEREMNYAASLASAKGVASIEYVNMLLTGWRAGGLTRLEDIESKLADNDVKRSAAVRMLTLAGISKEPGKRDIDMFERFMKKYGMPEEVVFLAAECSYGMAAPMKAMEKILSVWSEQGVKDLDAAKEANKRHRASYTKKSQGFDERSYTEDELDARVKDPLKDIIIDPKG